MGMSELELRVEARDRYFHSARNARIKDQWARVRGKSSSLLRYEHVAGRLHLRQQIPIGHCMVPLSKIVGSVGRYREFTQGFFPREAVLQDRWIAIDVLMNSMRGFPPIELYKIGDAYFVIDGNHRISVSRANGNHDIEANVTEVQSNVHLTVEDFTGDQWLIKAAYSEFLAETKIDILCPEQELLVGDAQHYQTLLQHISVHRYLANQARPYDGWTPAGCELSWEEAVLSWYEKVYLPVVKMIRAHHLRVRFPHCTEADLYLAITQYRERIAEEYGLAPLAVITAVTVFAANHGAGILSRLTLALRQGIIDRLPWENPKAKWPVGMTQEEYVVLRLRHDAGELSLKEARRKAYQETPSPSLCCDAMAL